MKPILFSTDMVRAILEGRKTVTRRVIKNKDIINAWDIDADGTPIAFIDQATGDSYSPTFPCQYQPGDILYVRETWCQYGKLDDNECLIEGTEKYYYRADGENPTPFNNFLVQHPGWDEYRETPVWRPSIHMPKEAARLFLRVTDVRVERLLTPFLADGAAVLELKKEGMMLPSECVECIGNYGTPACVDIGDDSECGMLDEIRGDFSTLWDTTIKPANLSLYSWNANPWVWVIEFEQIRKETALKGGNG